jgi:hypothetical protein
MQLPVYVCNTDAIGINECQMLNATSYQALSTPAANATYPENYYFFGHNSFHPLFSKQQFGSLKDSFVEGHPILKFIEIQVIIKCNFYFAGRKYKKLF